MSDIKWIYCPEYDKLLEDCRPILKEKIKTHLHERQIAVFKAFTQMIAELNTVKSQKFEIPEYLESVINDREILKSIDVLVDEWNGPTYGNRLINQLNGNEENVEIIDSKKFINRAINWIQQTSYKIFGLFFAKHIINIKQHLNIYCPSCMMNYSCFKFVVELLNGEITLHRSGRKPLIRYTTLRDSVDIQTAFGMLHHSLNLIELKNIIKAKRKNSGKYTITAQSLAEEFKKRCNHLLNQEKENLGLLFKGNNNYNKTVPVINKYHHTTNISLRPVYSNTTYNYGADRGGNIEDLDKKQKPTRFVKKIKNIAKNLEKKGNGENVMNMEFWVQYNMDFIEKTQCNLQELLGYLKQFEKAINDKIMSNNYNVSSSNNNNCTQYTVNNNNNNNNNNDNNVDQRVNYNLSSETLYNSTTEPINSNNYNELTQETDVNHQNYQQQQIYINDESKRYLLNEENSASRNGGNISSQQIVEETVYHYNGVSSIGLNANDRVNSITYNQYGNNTVNYSNHININNNNGNNHEINNNLDAMQPNHLNMNRNNNTFQQKTAIKHHNNYHQQPFKYINNNPLNGHNLTTPNHSNLLSLPIISETMNNYNDPSSSFKACNNNISLSTNSNRINYINKNGDNQFMQNNNNLNIHKPPPITTNIYNNSETEPVNKKRRLNNDYNMNNIESPQMTPYPISIINGNYSDNEMIDFESYQSSLQ